jgi:quinol monooxygenase YgiN
MTVHRSARFAVRDGELETALSAIRMFLEHTRTESGTLRYESYRSADRPNRFLHVMAFADEAAEEAHGPSDAVRAFTSALYPVCVAEPTFERWDLIE